MLYGTCSTAAGTAAKVASVSGFSLYSGVTVAIRFSNANTAASPTLNVSSTGAKAVYTNGVRYAYWTAGATVVLTYDGTNWQVASSPVYASTAVIGNGSGFNCYVDSSSFNVRSGSTNLSRFTSSTVELGKSSAAAQVKMCGGNVVLGYNANNGDFSISKSTTVDGSLTCKQITVQSGGTLNAAGNLYLGAGKSTGIRGFYQGSKVLTISSTTWAFVRLFTNSEYTAIVGREYKTGDVVLVCNGDYQAYPAQIYAASYRGNETSWYVGIPTGRSGNVRVNYLIVAVT